MFPTQNPSDIPSQRFLDAIIERYHPEAALEITELKIQTEELRIAFERERLKIVRLSLENERLAVRQRELELDLVEKMDRLVRRTGVAMEFSVSADPSKEGDKTAEWKAVVDVVVSSDNKKQKREPSLDGGSARQDEQNQKQDRGDGPVKRARRGSCEADPMAQPDPEPRRMSYEEEQRRYWEEYHAHRGAYYDHPMDRYGWHEHYADGYTRGRGDPSEGWNRHRF